MVEWFIMLHMLDRQTTEIYFTLSILILETQKQAQMKHKVVECHVSKLTFDMLKSGVSLLINLRIQPFVCDIHV